MGVSELEKLRVLVDSSLHSPDYGVVNFQQLHKVLHGILSHLGLQFDGNTVSSSTTADKQLDSGRLTDNLQDETVEKEREKDDKSKEQNNVNISTEEGRISNFQDENDQETGRNVENIDVER